MTDIPKENRVPVFVSVACVLCSLTFGLICSNQTLGSDGVATSRDYLFLILYECLSLASYLSALWFFKRLLNFRSTEIVPALFLISVLGTIIPYAASSIQIWVEHQLELGWFLRQSAVAWLLLNVGMMLMMAVTAMVGFLLSLPFLRKRSVAGT